MKGEINIFEFTEKFPTEKACIDFLEKSRWPNGKIPSPFSKGGETYRIKTRPGLYKCKETRKQFSVRHGSVFEESRLPLKKWFLAIFILTSIEKGISSAQLAKYLEVTQKTAWFMLQRIRFAVEHEDFTRPFEGIVAIDEHFSRASQRGGKPERGAENKTPEIGTVEGSAVATR